MSNIEKHIQVSSFSSEQQKLIVHIYCVNSLIVHHFEKTLDPFQISFQQFNVLRILRGQHPRPATIQLIRDRMLDRGSDASRVVARLVKAGLIQNQINKEDRRRSDVTITEKGLQLLKQLDEKEAHFISAVDGLTAEEYVLMNQLMQKIFERLSRS